MRSKKSGAGLGVGLLNGIVLGAIGIFLLATPLTSVQLTAEEARLDYVAGGILVGLSAVMFILHFAARSRH